MKRVSCLALACIIMLALITGCRASGNAEAENLAKLAKVWGFAKYTHQAFITGERCWDEELLNLIPIVRAARPRQVNGILYDWFAGLGEDGYDRVDTAVYAADLLAYYRMIRDMYVDAYNYVAGYDEAVVNQSGFDRFSEGLGTVFEGFYLHGVYWPRRLFADIRETLDPLWESMEGLRLGLSDGTDVFDWETYRAAYLEGYTLYIAMYAAVYDFIARYGAVTDWETFHNDFTYFLTGIEPSTSVLRNQADMGWINRRYLGKPLYTALSRFEKIHITDRSSAPVFFDPNGTPNFSNQSTYNSSVISNPDYRLLGLFRLWNAMLYYYPNMDIIDYDWHASLREYIPAIQEGTDRRSYVDAIISLARRLDDAHVFIGNRSTHTQTPNDISDVTASHVLLEGNIGLINPMERVFNWGDTQHVMEAFADTDGLIVDLRQYPCFSIVYELAEYIVEERTNFVLMSRPEQSVPGSFVFSPPEGLFSGGITSPYAYYYDKPVVILMNRSTMSRGEFAVMSLRNGSNVTVMGSNSIGANGNVAYLPLPGIGNMMFTSLGVFTPEGGQTHRIGLSPDIYVETEALMETAIQFILDKRQ
jgi:hypothetical protein